MSDTETTPDFRINPETGKPGVAESPSMFRVQLRRYVRTRLNRGGSFVKTKRVADCFDVTRSKAGTNLRWLAKDGAVERWGGRGSGTWRITVDDGGDSE